MHERKVIEKSVLLTCQYVRKLYLVFKLMSVDKESNSFTRIILNLIFNFYSLSFSLDLQLAAEIGKALLERNKELERETLHLQSLNGEQALEIDVSFLSPHSHQSINLLLENNLDFSQHSSVRFH